MAKTEGVIIGVICDSSVRNTQLTSEESRPVSGRIGFLAGIVANRPVPFMEEAFTVAPGAHALARQVEYFGSKA